MSKAQAMMNRTNVKHHPQWTNEGSDAASYGLRTLAANVGWIVPLQKSSLTHGNEPEYQDNLFAGKLDNQGKFKIWNNETVTLKGRLLNTSDSLELFDWASATSGEGKQGPASSRTWIQSYIDSDNVETWEVFKGCKPLDCKLMITKEDGAMIELIMNAQYAYEAPKPTNSTEAAALGFAAVPTGIKTVENRARPIRFQDVGDLLYKPIVKSASAGPTIEYTNIPYRSFTAGVTWGLRRQDSNGSDRDLFVDYASRTCSGSGDLFKAGRDLNEDAKTDNLHVAILQIEKATSTKKDVHAFKKFGTGNELHIIARVPGALGENLTVTMLAASGTASKATLEGNDLTITPKSSGDTLANLAALINDDPVINQKFMAGTKGTDSTSFSTASAKANLDNGVDKVRKLIFENFKWDPSAETLIEQTEATIESKNYTADSQTAIVKNSQIT